MTVSAESELSYERHLCGIVVKVITNSPEIELDIFGDVQYLTPEDARALSTIFDTIARQARPRVLRRDVESDLSRSRITYGTMSIRADVYAYDVLVSNRGHDHVIPVNMAESLAQSLYEAYECITS